MKDEKTVSLVLGSGGARGLAHIGIIRWLEEHGYKIASVAGCSAGAVVGGIYCAGKLDIFEEWTREIGTFDIVTLLDPSWGPGGLVKGERFIGELVSLVGDVYIEDLPIPYTAVATDIVGGKEVWFRDGKLFDAIRASLSIPLLFKPFHYRNMILVDGGVLNPVPIAPTFCDNTDLTIAVNLNSHEESVIYNPVQEIKSEPETREEVDGTDDSESGEAVSEGSRFRNRLSGLFDDLYNLTKKEDDEPISPIPSFGVNDVAFQAFEAMQSTISRQKLAAYPPDVVIDIHHQSCKMLEFNRAAELIELGYKRCEECLGGKDY